MKRGVWSEEEHACFLQAIRYYPEGPWSKIASCVGSRSARQVQTHAQRYYEKIQRHVRGLQRDRSKSAHKEHRIDEDVMRLQQVHKVMSAAKAAAPATAKPTPAATIAEATLADEKTEQCRLQQRLYRSKDPPPCLQRLAQLPTTQLSPVGVHEPMTQFTGYGQTTSPSFSHLPPPPPPAFEFPHHYQTQHQHQQYNRYSHHSQQQRQPLSPVFDRAPPRVAPLRDDAYYHHHDAHRTLQLPRLPLPSPISVTMAHGHRSTFVAPPLTSHLPPISGLTSYLPHGTSSHASSFSSSSPPSSYSPPHLAGRRPFPDSQHTSPYQTVQLR